MRTQQSTGVTGYPAIRDTPGRQHLRFFQQKRQTGHTHATIERSCRTHYLRSHRHSSGRPSPGSNTSAHYWQQYRNVVVSPCTLVINEPTNAMNATAIATTVLKRASEPEGRLFQAFRFSPYAPLTLILIRRSPSQPRQILPQRSETPRMIGLCFHCRYHRKEK